MGTKAEYWKHRDRYLSTARAYRQSEHGKGIIKEWWLRQKEVALTHYGAGVYACVRCGFSDPRALSIDHINGSGTRHTRSEGIHGSKIYRWLIKKGFPRGYQTLCMNCQFIKRTENGESTGGPRVYGSGGKK